MSDKLHIRDNRRPGWLWLENEVIEQYANILKPHGLAVYVAICKFANNSTQRAYPSVATIATLVGMSERAVHEKLALLAEVGLIHIESGKRDGKPNVYTLLSVKGMQDVQTGYAPDADRGMQEVQTNYTNNNNTNGQIPAPAGAGASATQAPKHTKAYLDSISDALIECLSLTDAYVTRNGGLIGKRRAYLADDGATPEDIQQFAAWFRSTYFKGKDGSMPTLGALEADWQQFRANRKAAGESVAQQVVDDALLAKLTNGG